MRWRVIKSRYPADPRKPWAAGSLADMAIGMGRPFATWAEAYDYARQCAR